MGFLYFESTDYIVDFFMKRKEISLPYLFLGAWLFCWINLSLPLADEMRSFSVASLAPVWEKGKGIQKYLSDRPDFLWSDKKGEPQEKVAKLELENTILRSQIEKMGRCFSLREELKERLSHIQEEMAAMPAYVIYRDPSSWSSSLWIDVGQEDNQVFGKIIVAKNSPVVFGASLVGVVDYVGKKQSRVRLITDSTLSPAVRAVRGGFQNREVLSLVNSLLPLLEGKDRWMEVLKELKKESEAFATDLYLAKGEIHGSSSPLWRTRNISLKGIGFNFDRPDEKGSSKKEIPILQVGDLLVTTGFDGVFPEGLQVGVVTFVEPPGSGGYAYGIQARPTAQHLNNLESVFVLPPRGE